MKATRPGCRRALGLLLGFAADRLLADPARWHPVAGFGRVAGAVEGQCWAPSRVRGTAYAAGLVGGVTALGVLVEHSARPRPVVHTFVTAAATWVVLGGASLDREGRAVTELLEAGRLPEARERLTHLVGRDTRTLTADEVARAVLESVAENTSDAVVAPLVLGAVAGVPGLLGYRAANTLDAMVGHRSERYAAFGWAAARLDDVANWVPARLTGLLTVACAPLVAEPGRGPRPTAGRPWTGSPARLTAARESYRVLRRDGGHHPSPNAGRCEAAFAGALGVRLGGVNVYGGHVEARPELGDGRPPEMPDLRRAVRLSRAVTLAAALVSAVIVRSVPVRGASCNTGGRR
jgi:adenosylcobinamide-phosphate synthase